MSKLAPVVLFTYNRPNLTKQVVESLKKNALAKESSLYIYSDAPKKERDLHKVYETREYIKSISGFKEINIIERESNWGLANSIINGATKILKEYGKIIVLEDDLVTSSNFLQFMNQALNFYETNKQVFSISGFTPGLPSLEKYNSDFYTGYRASSWGWGTWIDRWEDINWDVPQYKSFTMNPFQQLNFTRGGIDMPRMLKKQMSGKIDSWAIRWCFHQFLNNTYTIFPSVSKVQNIGIGEEATHTKYLINTVANLDKGVKEVFTFHNDLYINRKLVKEFKAQYSLWKKFQLKISIILQQLKK